MTALWIILGIVAFWSAVVLLTSFICFRMAFYVKEKKIIGPDEYPIPPGKEYEPYREQMMDWMRQTKQLPYEEIWITSFDGLKLYGKYYEYAPGAPLELMFHGYRGSAERDLCGGVLRCFALERNVLIVDQRACGHSDGNVITFGVLEHRDCLSWLEYAQQRFGPQQKIMLTGISMGASTVLIASGYDLPDNVVCILGDCGFSSAKEIIQKVIRDMKLPDQLLYPFVKLGAKLYGHFDPDETSAIEMVAKTKKPVFFIHGEEDDFVPCQMSRDMYEVCNAPKRLVVTPEACHGTAYMVDTPLYFRELRDFCKQHGI